jgi:hypothetical protein
MIMASGSSFRRMQKFEAPLNFRQKGRFKAVKKQNAGEQNHEEEGEKRFYTIAEVLSRLNITRSRLSRIFLLFNIVTRPLPGSTLEYIDAHAVRQIEHYIKERSLHD